MTIRIIQETIPASKENGLENGYVALSAQFNNRLVNLGNYRIGNPELPEIKSAFEDATQGMSVLFSNARRASVDFYTVTIDKNSHGFNATRRDDMDALDEYVRAHLKERAQKRLNAKKPKAA